MRIVLPFKAWLPNPEFADQVAVRSSGYADNQEIFDLLSNNPLCYLHAVKPHLLFGTSEKNPALHFAHGANYIKQMIGTGVLGHSEEEALYLYRQTSIESGFYYQGVIGLCNAEAYNQGNVKVHEHTLTHKENLLIEHIQYTKMSGEPVLIMHDPSHDLEQLKRSIMANDAILRVEVEGIRHELWVADGEKLAALIKEFDVFEKMYIADGHHRSAAASKVINNGETNAKGYMTLFIDKSDLNIAPFHRLIKTDVSKLMDFLNGNNFKVSQINNFHELLPDKRCFGFYFLQSWHQVEYTGTYFKENTLDVSIIEEAFINDFCDIANSKTDDRVNFVEGTAPIYQSEDRVNKGDFDLLIALNPCEIDDICKVADQQHFMPPKSTYVLPKLLTGLVLQQF